MSVPDLNSRSLPPKELAEQSSLLASELRNAIRAALSGFGPAIEVRGSHEPSTDKGSTYEFKGWRVFVGGLELDIVNWRATGTLGERP